MPRNAVGAVNSALTPCSCDHAPELAGVGRADRLALVEHGRRPDEQRRVDDVGVPDDPPDVGGGEHDLAGPDVVDVGHRPRQRDGVAAVVALDALGLAGGARGVEHVERVGGRDGDAVGGLGGLHGLGPVEVALGHRGLGLRALEDDHAARVVLGELDGLVEQGLVLDDPLALDAAGRADDRRRAGRRRSGRPARGRRTRRRRRCGRRRSARRRASRRPPRGSSACR